MYEFFEHTADVGVRVRAASIEQVFIDAARGLTALLVENPRAVQPRDSRTIKLPDDPDRAQLLYDWLGELLYLFDAEQLLLCEFVVHLDHTGLRARVRGEPFDPRRHHLAHEVKAVTYHQLSLKPADRGYLAQFICDI